MRVPVFCTSTLKAIAKNEQVGVYGNGDSEPVQIRFIFLTGLGLFFLWIVLLPLFLLKSNRKKAAWLILALVVLLHALLLSLSWSDPSGAFTYNVIIHPLATGMGMVWLIGGMFKPGRRLLNGTALTVCMVLAGIIGLACYYGCVFRWSLSLDRATLSFQPSWAFTIVKTIIYYSLIGLIAALGPGIAAALSGKPIRRFRFMAWLAVCDMVLFFLGTAVLIFVINMFHLGPDWLLDSFLPRGWKWMLVFGAVTGLLVFAAQLPFILLSRVSPFFTERYKAIFGVEMLKAEPKRK